METAISAGCAFSVSVRVSAPGEAAAIEGLGAARAGEPGGPADRPAAREELWGPLLLLALAILLVEWAVYHRDTILRARRALALRVGGAPAGDEG
jgi:hypothetical protein